MDDFSVRVRQATRVRHSEDLGAQRGIGVRPAPWLHANRFCRIRDATQDGTPSAPRAAYSGPENVVKLGSGAKLAPSHGTRWDARTAPSHQEHPTKNPPRIQGMLSRKGRFRMERTAEDATHIRQQREQRTPYAMQVSACRKFGADPYNVSTTGATGVAGRVNNWIKQPASWARRAGVRHAAFEW
jgi:hypothetical protein